MRYDFYKTMREFGISEDVIMGVMEDDDYCSSLDDCDFSPVSKGYYGND